MIYRNDSIIITYDLNGTQYVDSIWVEVTTNQTSKIENIHFAGDVYCKVYPGKNKKIVGILPKDTLPLEGINYEFRIKARTLPYVPSKRRSDWSFGSLFYQIRDPKYMISLEPFLTMPKTEKKTWKIGGAFSIKYLANDFFAIGNGTEFYRDSLIQSFPIYVDTHFQLFYPLPIVICAKYGYSLENNGTFLALGFRYHNKLNNIYNLTYGIEYKNFNGYDNSGNISFHIGVFVYAIERNRRLREREFRFRDVVLIPELKIDLLNRVALGGGIIIAYKPSAYISHGIGISWESFRLKAKKEFEYEYFSTFYNNQITYYEGIVEAKLNFSVVPVFFDTKLFLSESIFRPFVNFNYGLTAFSKSNYGKLQNGLIVGCGFGVKYKLSDYYGLMASIGFKYLRAKHTYLEFTNYNFGYGFVNVGLMF